MENKKVLEQGSADTDIVIRIYSGGIILTQTEDGERPHVISVNIDSLTELVEMLASIKPTT